MQSVPSIFNMRSRQAFIMTMSDALFLSSVGTGCCVGFTVFVIATNARAGETGAMLSCVGGVSDAGRGVMITCQAGAVVARGRGVCVS